MSERRVALRKSIPIYFNKYLGGLPHLCRALDLSSTGLRLLSYTEPAGAMSSFAIELGLPGHPGALWLWARVTHERGKTQGVELTAYSPGARHKLERFLKTHEVKGPGAEEADLSNRVP